MTVENRLGSLAEYQYNYLDAVGIKNIKNVCEVKPLTETGLLNIWVKKQNQIQITQIVLLISNFLKIFYIMELQYLILILAILMLRVKKHDIQRELVH